MKNMFKKTVLFALLAALGLASLPFVSASAAPATDDPPPQREVTPEKLEQVWARQQRIYERLGNAYDQSDAFVERVQNLIEKASENGKDVSAVQAALDAFEAAIKEEAHPIYESAKGIISSHQGFDNDGKVTDTAKALETVKSMGGKLREIKDAMNGTGRALREAIKAFREANPRRELRPSTNEGG